MENQNRLLVALAALLLLLVAAILIAEKGEGEPKSDEPTEYSAMLPELKADSVQRLELQLSDETRVFVRHEDGWRIAAPFEAEGDNTRIDAIVGTLATAEAGEPIEGAPADFGLAPPVAVAKLTTTDGIVHELRLGRDAPVGGHTYLQQGEGQPIRASRTRLSSAVNTPLVELRVVDLWSLPLATLDRFDISSPTVRLELRKTAGDWWIRASLAAPGEASPPELTGLPQRADPARVEAILGQLAGLQASGFVEAPVFDATALPWSLTAGAAGASWELRAGQTDDGSWVASGPRQAGLVTLSPGWEEPLLRPISDWWASDLLRVDRLDTASLDLVLGERRLSATQTGGAWSPPQAEATLQAVAAVRVDRARPVSIEGPAWGSVRLTSTDGGVRQVELHQELADGGRAARDSAGGEAFAVPATEITRLLDALPAAP